MYSYLKQRRYTMCIKELKEEVPEEGGALRSELPLYPPPRPLDRTTSWWPRAHPDTSRHTRRFPTSSLPKTKFYNFVVFENCHCAKIHRTLVFSFCSCFLNVFEVCSVCCTKILYENKLKNKKFRTGRNHRHHSKQKLLGGVGGGNPKEPPSLRVAAVKACLLCYSSH